MDVIAVAVLWIWIVFIIDLFGQNWSVDLLDKWCLLNVSLLDDGCGLVKKSRGLV